MLSLLTLRRLTVLLIILAVHLAHVVQAQDFVSDVQKTCEEWGVRTALLDAQWQNGAPQILVDFENRHREYLNNVSVEQSDAFITAVDSCSPNAELKLWAANQRFLAHPDELSSDGFGELVQQFADLEDCSKYVRIHHLYLTMSSEILKRPNVFYANILKNLREQAAQEGCREGEILMRLTEVHRLNTLKRVNEAMARVNSITLQQGSPYLRDCIIRMHIETNISAGNFKAAIQWLQRRRVQMADQLDAAETIGVLNDIGYCFHRYGDLDSARYYYTIAQERARLFDHRAWQGILSGNMSMVLKDEGRYEEAIVGLLHDYRNTINTHDYISGVRALLSVSESYQMLGQLDSALYWLDKAEGELGRPGGDLEADSDTRRSIHFLRYSLHRAQDNAPEALLALEQYQRIHDSLTELNHRRKTRNLTAVMTAEKLETEKTALQHENTLNRQLLKKQQNNLFTVLVFTGGLLVVLTFLFYSYREQKRARTETSQLLALTRQQNEKLKNFALIVSHNLRGSAGNINGLINLMEEAESEGESKRFRGMLRESSDKLNKTVGGLRNLIENYAIRGGEEEVFAAKPIIDRVVDEVRNNIKHKSLEVQVEVPEALKVRGIPSYMESMVHNFATNASKYRRPDRTPRLIIRGETQNGEVVLRFVDNGRGMDLDAYGDQVFGLFNTFHQHEDSQGVGLYVTRNQIEGMGGSISVDSTPGEGTTFTVRLQSAN